MEREASVSASGIQIKKTIGGGHHPYASRQTHMIINGNLSEGLSKATRTGCNDLGGVLSVKDPTKLKGKGCAYDSPKGRKIVAGKEGSCF